MKHTFLLVGVLLISFGLFAQKGNKEVYFGNKAYQKGDLKTAIVEYQKALEIAPTNQTAKINLAIAQSKLSKTDASIKNFDQALQSSTNSQKNAMINYDKGTTAAKAKQYQEAIDAFKKSLMVNPEDNEARENLQKAINELKQQQQKNNKDKNNKQDQKDKKQQQKQKDKDQQPKDQPNQNKQNSQPQMSKADAEKLLNALRSQEKETQKKLQQKAGGGIPQNGKDW